MKSFLLSLIQGLTVKAAVTTAVCVTAGVAVTATATTMVYKNKTAEYESTIARLESENSGNAELANGAGGESDETAVRVVDGILEVWDGSQLID